jgi:hypothetical protein
MESGATSILDDLNNIRSMLSYFNDLQVGNWYDALTAPTGFESATIRGLQGLAQALHDQERKRRLHREYMVGVDVGGGSGVQHVILGAGDLPNETTAAVGAVTTLGTVVAQATSFDTASASDELAGANALQPKNLVRLTDATTGDVILDSGSEEIFGLLQSESGTDGHTISTTTPNRVQISFVKRNATNTDLELITAGDMDGKSFDYGYIERRAHEDMNEEDFLNSVGVVDTGAANTDRQAAYDNQSTTPVNVTTNATLDLEGAGLVWKIRDDLEADLFSIVEGSAGGTSQFNIHSDVDEYDNDAAVVNFAQGASIASGKTRPIDIGVNDGLVESTAGILEVKSAADLILNDGNMVSEGTWTGPGVKVSDTTAEVAAYETAFGGEVSLMNALVQAKNTQLRTKVQAVLTSNVAADTDVNGPGTPHANTDVDLAAYDAVPTSFVQDVEVFLNGEILRNGADAAANEDVYPGGTPAEGDLKFEFALLGTGSRPDQLTVIVNGQ